MGRVMTTNRIVTRDGARCGPAAGVVRLPKVSLGSGQIFPSLAGPLVMRLTDTRLLHTGPRKVQRSSSRSRAFVISARPTLAEGFGPQPLSLRAHVSLASALEHRPCRTYPEKPLEVIG
jgi:hypothetical protein